MDRKGMVSNRSNYPRTGGEEEAIETFKPWQWAILFIGALAPQILQFWLPTLNVSYARYGLLVEGAYFVGSVAILLVPVLSGGGSLMRATIDRLREPTNSSHLWMGGIIAGLQLLAVLFHSARPLLQGGSASRLFGSYMWQSEFLLRLANSVLHALLTYYLILLLLTIPSKIQRFKTMGIFLVVGTFFNITGTYVLYQQYPMLATFLPQPSSMTAWYVESILLPILFYAKIWIIDRVSFPSFRTLALMFGMSIVLHLIFADAGEIEGIAVAIVGLLIVIRWAMAQCPDALSLPWKDDEALQCD